VALSNRRTSQRRRAAARRGSRWRVVRRRAEVLLQRRASAITACWSMPRRRPAQDPPPEQRGEGPGWVDTRGRGRAASWRRFGPPRPRTCSPARQTGSASPPLTVITVCTVRAVAVTPSQPCFRGEGSAGDVLRRHPTPRQAEEDRDICQMQRDPARQIAVADRDAQQLAEAEPMVGEQNAVD